MKILVGAEGADAGIVSRPASWGTARSSPQIYPRLTPDEHFEPFARDDQLSGGTLS